MRKTIKQSEINKFQEDSQNWWQEDGAFSPLHRLNPLRLRFIRDTLDHSQFSDLKNETKPFKNLKILDVGCGGGLVCEPLARLGATVTGLDADAQAIKVATAHAATSTLDISYQALAIEDYRKKNRQQRFDVITALEIIEHVDNVDFFLDELTAALKPGGILFLSTLNQTIKSWLLGIVAAEYLLRWVPAGTHHWRQFIRPSTLARKLRNRGFRPLAARGITFNPVKQEFALSPHDLDVNYIMAFRKES